MKRILFFCAAMLAVSICNAQSVQVLKKGKIIFSCSETEDLEVVFKEKGESTNPYNGHEYVDLGLPSGIKWATCNVGASNPEEYGDYFAWGEVEPYYTEGHSLDNPCTNWKTGKTGYNLATYKWCNGSIWTMTKYCWNSSYGTVDGKSILDPEDDAAHVNWGGDWRMPTRNDFGELIMYCTWTWATLGGVNGYELKGPNGNSIFLPTTGYRLDNTFSLNKEMHGEYWSSSLDSDGGYGAYCLHFYSSDWETDERTRQGGLPVRAVCP